MSNDITNMIKRACTYSSLDFIHANVPAKEWQEFLKTHDDNFFRMGRLCDLVAKDMAGGMVKITPKERA